jgi:serine/threonine protein kinase
VFLHSSRFVHKSISPENIIVLQSSSGKLGTPFLIGFEQFRFAEGRTFMSGDCLWEKNLYRHPRRQGLYPEEQYTMRHDIYSAGVCLLEIGLWSSFVSYSEDQESSTPRPELPISALIGAKDQRKAAADVKAILVEMARSRLPMLMGKIYTDIVVSCLTCLDKNNEGFGDEKEFEDEDGVLVGVRYIEKVILPRSRFLRTRNY